LGTSTNSLLLLDTGVDPRSDLYLQTFAQQVDLPFLRIPVGLDQYQGILTRVVLQLRFRRERGEAKAALSDAVRRSTDHAMALDLIGNLTRIMLEEEAIEGILELFAMLFVPARLVYVPMVSGRPREAYAYPESIDLQVDGLLQYLEGCPEDFTWTPSGNGFVLRIGYQDEVLGILEIDGIALSQHKEHYLNLARIISRVCGLSISNARAFQRMKEAEATIKHLAFHDPLTQLPNRMLFNDRFSRALAQAHRAKRKLAVMLMDLNRFKEVNDTLGHSAGDQLLRCIARRLQGILRKGDTVARVGGDEFVMLLAEISHERDAAKVAHRVLETLQVPFMIEGRGVRIGMSVGIAVYPCDGDDADTLLRHADLAMYHSKKNEQSNYQRFSTAMQ
jgi:diguanylate cyclase (GGDEF)-like protein